MGKKDESARSQRRAMMASAAQYVFAMAKWLVLAAVLGAGCGAVGAAFHLSIDGVTGLREQHPWIIWLLAPAGVLTLLLYRWCRVDLDAGTNLIFRAVTEGQRIPPLLAPLIFVGTVFSHLFGASVGREGAALQLGGSMGRSFGKLIRVDEADVRTLTMAGMAACFAALFGTPLAAIFFVLEVTVVGTVRYYAFLPCGVAAYVGYLISRWMGAKPMAFVLSDSVGLTGLTALQVAGLGAVTGLVGAVFCLAIHGAEHGLKRLLPNPYVRIALGGAAMSLLVWGFGLQDYAGAGGRLITLATQGSADTWAFLLKMGLTVLCVSVGFRGGEIVPTLFIGACFGCVFGPVLGLPPGLSAGVGMISTFCAVTNAPIASLFLAVELFGLGQPALFAIAVVASFVTSAYTSLYTSQTTTYSKIKHKMFRSPE